MDTLTFINNYEEILHKRGIAKGTFYSECKISDAAVSQWRKGKTSPFPYTLERISEYLGVPLDELFAERKEKPVPNEDELDKMRHFCTSMYIVLIAELIATLSPVIAK